MENNRRAVGTWYERKAGEYLEAHGYEIMQYNYRCKKGEIDLIARDGEYLVFCEVKYISDSGKGHPGEAVDLRKQRVISQCAMYYLLEKGISDMPCRFDVVGIEGERITLFQNAFDCMA